MRCVSSIQNFGGKRKDYLRNPTDCGILVAEGGIVSMTDTQHPEPSRADLVAFAEEVWHVTNEREEAHGRPPNEYTLTRICKSHDASLALWVIDFLYPYDLSGLRRTVYGYYVITQEPHSGKLQFVRWDEMKEEQ